ncbi:AAA family ATPase [Roseomonas sp. CECT 9278]|uniref:AAA family ATPase n=1 Tax=Roseomonas sp. CECT 9278 TaxID=2845823 RepID=UPI001E39B409|nr:AAA family ATPase [Roseomonas sp. CECT 9278]CAH0130266.1 hypothetical protein ROS9278_00220 [Roseomonas sp. CECT 9278]
MRPVVHDVLHAMWVRRGHPEAGRVIPDVIQRDTMATIYGPPASLKSFLALHVANAIAYGMEWRGKPIKPERVAYIAAEGASAVGALRNEAWRIYYQQDVTRSRMWRRRWSCAPSA